MSTRSTHRAGIDVLMAHEASTEGTPSRFGQGWPSRRRPAPWFVRFAVTRPSLFTESDQAQRALTTPSLLAHIRSDKFCDGLPFHHQEWVA
jgi:hypothetical protein